MEQILTNPIGCDQNINFANVDTYIHLQFTIVGNIHGHHESINRIVQIHPACQFYHESIAKKVLLRANLCISSNMEYQLYIAACIFV